MTGRVDRARNDLRQSDVTAAAGVSKPDDRIDVLIRFQFAQFHNIGAVDDDDNLVEVLLHVL